MKLSGNFGLNPRTNTGPHFGQNPIPYAGGQDIDLYQSGNACFCRLKVEAIFMEGGCLKRLVGWHENGLR